MKWFLTIFVALVFAGNRDHNAPYVTGDGFRAIADQLYDETYKLPSASLVKPYDIIFVKGDLIDDFIRDIIPDLNVPFILVTHNSEDGPAAHHRKFLRNRNLVVWFAQNASGLANRKLVPIPIGIENRYVMDPEKFAFLESAKRRKFEKNINLYINFSIATNPRERAVLYSKPMQKRYVVEGRLPITEYLEKVACSEFVASPPGNGFDCHRTWEALYLGSYPIVRNSHSNKLYSGLPVLLVNNYISFTPRYLSKMYRKYRNDFYNMEKLKMEYWWDRIRSYKKSG